MRLLVRKALFCLMVLTGAISQADEYFQVDFPHGHRAQLDAYARAVNVPTLMPSGANELRVWVDDVMTGHITGFLASSDKLRECRSTYEGGTTIVVRRGKCRTTAKGTTTASALALLEDLVKLHGLHLNCGMVDGSSVEVEGVVDGRVFSFSAGNPGICPDAGSMLVTKVLRLLGASNLVLMNPELGAT